MNEELKRRLKELYTDMMSHHDVAIQMLIDFNDDEYIIQFLKDRNKNIGRGALTIIDSLDISEKLTYVVRWIAEEFVKSVINNIEIRLERRKSQDNTLHIDRENKNFDTIRVVQEIFFDKGLKLDDELFSNNINLFYKKNEDDHEMYYIKDVALFKDSLTPIAKNKKTFFHGTSIPRARNILKEKLFKSDQGYTSNSFYNKNKVFFSDNFDGSKFYTENLSGVACMESIIFEINLSDNDVYKREHLLIYRKNPILYFKTGEISTDAIKSIYIVRDNNEVGLISNEELVLHEPKRRKRYTR